MTNPITHWPRPELNLTESDPITNYCSGTKDLMSH